MSELHNPEFTLKSRHSYYIIQNTIFLKYILNYIIHKLFSNSRLIFGLCNPKYDNDTRRIKKYFHVLYGVTEEHMEM